MKHIFVSNTALATDTTTDSINDVGAGEIAVFNQLTGAIHTTNTVMSKVPYIFAVGYNDKDSKKVKPDVITIDWGKVKNVVYKPYAVGVKKKMTFGDSIKELVFGTTIVANKTYTIVVENRKTPIYDITRKRYYSVVSTASDTATTLVDKLVAKINADEHGIVTAAALATNKGISFESNSIGINFGVQLLDECVNIGWTIETTNAGGTAAIINGVYYDANTTPTLTTKYGNSGALVNTVGYAAYSEGTGSSDQILALEQELSSHKGDIKSQYRTTDFYNAPTNVVSGNTYDLFDIEFSGGASQSPMQAESFTQHLMLACKKDEACIAELKVYFGLAAPSTDEEVVVDPPEGGGDEGGEGEVTEP